MKYRIQIQPSAIQEIEDGYAWIFKDSPEYAKRWRERLLATLQTLRVDPDRCPLASENDYFSEEVRQLLFGKRIGVYRILFTIADDTVAILHVRHAARRFLGE